MGTDMKKETWLCSYCEMRNPAEATVCQFCKTVRKVGTEPQMTEDAPTSTAVSDDRNSTWLCAYCEMTNSSGTTVCQFCHRDRSGRPAIPSGKSGGVYFPGGGHGRPADKNPLKKGNLVFGKKPDEPVKSPAAPMHSPASLPGTAIGSAVRESVPPVGSPIVFPTMPDTETVYADASLPAAPAFVPAAGVPAVNPAATEPKPWEPVNSEPAVRPAKNHIKQKKSPVRFLAWALILLLLSLCICVLIYAVLTS